MTLAEAVALVERVAAAAARRARLGLESVSASVPVPIDRIALRACPALPATIEARIADNRAQTLADSVMYREALGDDALDGFLRAMGRSAGPPWQAKHKLAAAAALASRGRR